MTELDAWCVPGQMELGEYLRDTGAERAAARSGAWADRAFAHLEDLCHRYPVVTADHLRDVLAVHDDEPTHPNAYGGVFRRALRAGLVAGTDRTVKSTRPDAHARRLTVWRSLLWTP